MTINCVIIEDEPLAMERIRSYVEQVPFLRLTATFDDGLDALLYLQSTGADLVFLDINMGAISGIRLLETSAIRSQVIITTAYDEFALKGFELQVTDYLLKPFSFERFLQAVNRVKENLQARPVSTTKKFLFIKTEYRLEKVMLDELLYIEGMRDYRRIHTVTRKIMTLQTFTDLEQELPEQLVCRVHKSWMVALDKIDAIERDSIHIGNTVIPVSETYRKRFRELLGSAG